MSIVFAIVQYSHYNHAGRVKEIHATRRGAEQACEAKAREESFSRWPQDEYDIHAIVDGDHREWTIYSKGGSAIETWSLMTYDLIDP